MLNYTYGGSTENCWPAVVNVYTCLKLWMSRLHVLELEIKRSVLAKTGMCVHSIHVLASAQFGQTTWFFWGRVYSGTDLNSLNAG